MPRAPAPSDSASSIARPEASGALTASNTQESMSQNPSDEGVTSAEQAAQ